ncbi:GNAT family N-acetyltransferase [Cellulomonas sp. ICMP 17802]|uniref:GNAT family N-acetyltransferase n=1 Tax=Cellulomonas sp. ICMP 17802 TaxID=3239199 RepID=UPI00351BC9A5
MTAATARPRSSLGVIAAGVAAAVLLIFGAMMLAAARDMSVQCRTTGCELDGIMAGFGVLLGAPAVLLGLGLAAVAVVRARRPPRPRSAAVHPVLATPRDVDAIHALRRALEDWMAATGTVQWPRGSLPRERIAAQVAAGQWHVVRDDAGVLVGTVRLLWSDPDFWGDDDTPAVYVHGLMVDRRHTGAGVGRALLDWAVARGRDAGVPLFRLDCRTTNPVLRTYYEAYGFTAVGQRDFADFSCTLLELDLRRR